MAPTGNFRQCQCGMALCCCHDTRTYTLPPPIMYIRDPEQPDKDKLIAALERQLAGMRQEVFRLRQENQRRRNR